MMTIDVNLKHYCETCNNLKHKEVHAYFGHLTTVPTYEFLKSKNGRPFIISRSNSVGTGVYAGHWTGDNVATWDFLRLSISGNFLFQIFGIQMVGADICGFHLNTNEELCSRWMQVGSFYPFSRNHN
jgi:alpha-glucosidase (family GH31 glycosyl hydrolase)